MLISDKKQRGLSEGASSLAGQDEMVKEILVVPLNVDSECPGMMSEQKVLSMDQENKPRRVKYHDVPNYEEAENAGMFTSKRTRFSLSQDQESIGKVSNKETIDKKTHVIYMLLFCFFHNHTYIFLCCNVNRTQPMY